MMLGQVTLPLPALSKDVLCDSNKGQLRSHGGFAEAADDCGIHVDPVVPGCRKSELSETFVSISETPCTQKSLFYFESIHFEPNKQT